MRRLYRDRWDKKIAGICGGLGRLLSVDPTILRLGLLSLCLFTAIFPLILLYLIGWALIPLGPRTYVQFSSRRLYRSRVNRKLAGICGGIAEMTTIDATIIRLIVVVVALITGIVPLTIIYILGSLIIPESPPLSQNRFQNKAP